jgi:hypothetical protein
VTVFIVSMVLHLLKDMDYVTLRTKALQSTTVYPTTQCHIPEELNYLLRSCANCQPCCSLYLITSRRKCLAIWEAQFEIPVHTLVTLTQMPVHTLVTLTQFMLFLIPPCECQYSSNKTLTTSMCVFSNSVLNDHRKSWCYIIGPSDTVIN